MTQSMLVIPPFSGRLAAGVAWRGLLALALTLVAIGGCTLAVAALTQPKVPALALTFAGIMLIGIGSALSHPQLSGAVIALAPSEASGAVELMMLGFWSLFEARDLKKLSGARTLLVSAANTMATIIFVTASAVRWKSTIVLLMGATVGAYAGARLGLVLPPRVVRVLTLLCAYAVTATFFLRAI
jgi:hypothetical protein